MMMSRVKLAWPAIEAVETFYLQCLQKGCKIRTSFVFAKASSNFVEQSSQ